MTTKQDNFFLQKVTDDFSFLEEWEDRYAYLIDLGKKLEPLPESAYRDVNKVTGCMSQVWLLIEKGEGGKIILKGDSDAVIVKGLIALLIGIYADQGASQIARLDLEEIFTQLGLKDHLSPSRRNGFFSMVAKIKQTAQSLASG